MPPIPRYPSKGSAGSGSDALEEQSNLHAWLNECEGIRDSVIEELLANLPSVADD